MKTNRNAVILFRLKESEKIVLEELAKKLDVSFSHLMRELIREKAKKEKIGN